MGQPSRTGNGGAAKPLGQAGPLPANTPAAGGAGPQYPIPLEAGASQTTSATPIPARPSGNAPILLSQRQKRQAAITAGGTWRPDRKPVGVREEFQQRVEEGPAALVWRDLLEEHRSWAVSAAFHAVLVLILGLMTFSWHDGQIDLVSLAATTEDLEDLATEDLDLLRTDGPEIEDISSDIVDRVDPEALEPVVDLHRAAEGVNAASVDLSKFGLEQAPYNELLTELGRGTGLADARGTGKGRRGTGFGLDGPGGGFGGRGGRRGDAIRDGATKESEAAVDLALKWLAEHQLPDGGWSYNHQLAPSCQGQCPNPGSIPEARIAATAMGVLPFLGAGETNQVGRYQQTVAGGLTYLIRQMKPTPQGGDLSEKSGRMYSHGLAAIALCEAYAMQANARELRMRRSAAYDGSGRASPGQPARQARQAPIPIPELGPAAQAALDFIAYAQDPVGGGWRYQPRQPGDTSMVGWQLMAWMSGKMSYLRVSPLTAVRANHYLDHVQVDDYGSDYGYTDKNKKSKATQAIGLLCRMYLGWPRDHAGIAQGVQDMSHSGPSPGYMYYNYYATQVMHHYGGELWEKQWNPRMRDSLVAAQSKNGHTAGSWYFSGGDRGAGKGGRLYDTSLGAMTLEVYYRHMPLYGKDVLKHAARVEDAVAGQEGQEPADGGF